MPPKEENANAFTPRDQEIMAKAWMCFESEPKVDYNKLAEACGMTNPGSATNAWAKIKKKIIAHAGDVGGGADTGTPNSAKKTTTPKGTPKATPKRKKDVDNDDAETPTKKSRAGKGKAKKSEETVEDENESPVKKEEPGSDADAEGEEVFA